MIILSPELGISPEANLGGEVHDREMLKAIDQLGIVQLIILPLWKKHPEFKHAKIYYLPIPFIYPPWLFNFFILPYLFFLRWKYRFNALRVHSPYFVGLGAVILKFFVPDVKLIATYHHLEPNWLFDFWNRLAINQFDYLVTVSKSTKLELVAKYHPRKKIVIIPNAVESKYRPMLDVAKSPKTLLYLGALTKRKNIPFLFKLIKLLPPGYRLLIAGDGPERKKLEALAPDRVVFTGKIPENDKVIFYNQASIFIYPSKKEGFGLSVLEAMACGLPVIVSDIAAFRELVVSGKNGFVEKFVAQDWQRRIQQLEDQKLASRISQAARKTAAEYRWEKSAKQFSQFLKTQ